MGDRQGAGTGLVSIAAIDTRFVGHVAAFQDVVGESPRMWMVAEVDAHEGPVYFADEDALYFSTLSGRKPEQGKPVTAGPNQPPGSPDRRASDGRRPVARVALRLAQRRGRRR
jgi:hypothetical protein